MSDAPESKTSIQVIERMLSLLNALASMNEPAPLKTLSRMTGLHPSTAHRILSAITSSRMVERHENGAYSLGIRLLELGNIVKSRIGINRIALPIMQALHHTIGEAVNLGIRDRDEIVYIERTSSGRALVRVVCLVGERAPLHLTSLGKLFLAHDSMSELEAYAERTGLPGKTPNSLTSIAALRANLDAIREHDLAYDNEEAEIGLRCVASPIRDDQGQIVAGLSISAPSDRHRPEWGGLITTSALEISRALGFHKVKSLA